MSRSKANPTPAPTFWGIFDGYDAQPDSGTSIFGYF